MLDDARDGFDGRGELGRIGDMAGRAVKDETTTIRYPASGRITIQRPRLGRNSYARQPLRGLGPTEGDDLDRQWGACTQLIDALFRGCDQDIVVTREGHELLAQERAAATLDGVERGIDLVCPVDPQVEAIYLVELDQWNAEIAGQDFRAIGGWNGG